MRAFDTINLVIAELKSAPSSFVYSTFIVSVAVAIVTVLLSIAIEFRGTLPFPGGDEVLQARVVGPEGGTGRVDAGEVAHWRANAAHLADIGAFARGYPLVDLGGQTFKAAVGYITESVPGIVGVAPLVGRWPRASETDAVVIGYSIWDSALGKDPRVLQEGRVRIGDRQWRVVGVMPSGFGFPFREHIWWVVPFGSAHLKDLEVVLRLADTDAAQDVAQKLATLLPSVDGGRRKVRLLGFTEERSDVGERLLLGAVVLVVLGLVIVACTNLGNLVAEHTLGRAQDLAMHQSVGASGMDVVVQRLSESTVVGVLGSSFGVGLAWLAMDFLDSTLGGYLGYFWTSYRIHANVCILAILLAIAIPAVASLAPTLRTTRLSIAENLAMASMSISGRNRTTGSWIVMNLQLAISGVVAVSAIVIALAAAGRAALPGLEHVWLASVSFDGGRFENGTTLDDARRELVQSATQRNGIVSASLAGGGLLQFRGTRVSALDRPTVGEPNLLLTRWVTPEFFDAMSLEVVGGAPPIWGEPRAAWVNQAFVDTNLGRTVRFGERLRIDQGAQSVEDVPIRGVVADLHLDQRDLQQLVPRVYLPLEGSSIREHTLIVRTDGTAGGMRSLGETISSARADVMIGSFRTISDELASMAKFMEVMGMLVIAGATGSVAVFAIGLFGLISLELETQKKDYAVRSALGATALDVWMKIVMRAVASLLPGLSLCIGICMTISWYGEEALGNPLDNATSLGGVLAFVCVLFLATAALAAATPGLRLIRRNPADVLSEA